MKGTVFLPLLAVAVAASAGGVVAQEPATGNIARVVTVRPLAGHEAQFEAGVKDYMSWAAENGYVWSWGAWEVVTGEDTGDYIFATFNHDWADFDDPPVDRAANDAAIADKISPHAASVEVSFWAARSELSNPDPSGVPAPLSSVTSLVVKAGSGGDANYALKSYREVITEHQPDLYYYVFDLVNGGPDGSMLISAPMPSFAAMGTERGNFLADALGEFAARDLGERWFGSIASANSSMLVYRADLSFTPDSDGGS